jgi:methionine synthase II (cobalamin-independent)
LSIIPTVSRRATKHLVAAKKYPSKFTIATACGLGRRYPPGLVSHATNVVEHPEVVADRTLAYVQTVGRENVIAGTDCGLGGPTSWHDS